MCNTFEEYYELVKQRNKETHEDGHLIAFYYSEQIIELNKEYFRTAWKDGLSPYKALTFLHMDEKEKQFEKKNKKK